jgi:hypothetical protein
MVGGLMAKFGGMHRASASCLAGLLLIVTASGGRAADPFREQVEPFLKTFCHECHNQERAEAELNLMRYASASALTDDFRQWEHVVTFLKSGEMPPAKAKQPTAAERADILRVIADLMRTESRRLAGDPGIVLPRRLSNAEYNYTIRDLTGVDIRPADSFPVDPASGEGFSNTGEALTMSPSLFKKYFAAAQHVAEHVDFTPSGWSFAPYPVATYADQKKLHEQAILDFYNRHDVNYEAYLAAAWRYRGLLPAGRPANEPAGRPTIEDWAVRQKLSPKYLRSLWETLSGDPAESVFYTRWLRQRWQALPPPGPSANPDVSPRPPQELQSLAGDLRKLGLMLCPLETQAIVSHAGNAPIQHIERRQQTAAARDTFNANLLTAARRYHFEFRDLNKKESIRIVLDVSAVESGDAGGAGGAGREGGSGDTGVSTGGFVILKDLNFSTANSDGYKPNDDKRNSPLVDVLQKHAPDQLVKLIVGKHPSGDVFDPKSVVVPLNSSIELEIPTAAFANEKSINLYVDARLDREHTPSGMARFALRDRRSDGTGKGLEEFPFPLVNPDHASAGRLRESCQSLCAVVPNRFFYVDETRGLSAGFHLIEGFFRDDQPLCRHVLSDGENRELDRLWDELSFGTQIAERMLRGFVFFERSERNFMKHPDFDSFKEEDPELATVASVLRLEQAYFQRSGVKGTEEDLVKHPIHTFFAEIRRGLEQRSEQLKAAQPGYLRQLETFAESAYRRPLTDPEREQLQNFFHKLCAQEEFGIEKAVRASIVRILVSPHFCYRIDPPPPGQSVQPLSDLALASRLSYFLWSSQPDGELLAVAKAGKLHEDAVLRAQTRRMLKDPKVAGFALEFFGPWLRYRDFPGQESVSREVFPAFDAALKQAMFEEPTRLATHLIRRDRPVTGLLNGDTTLVNKRLAQHYGLSFPSESGDEWREVAGLHQQGRSGLLGMAVFLTKNSQPQRTSPVKRGFWVVHHLLGEHIPAPPADVVALPAKETDTNGKTIRQLLASHTDDAKCARCHVRFDSIGLAMEGFDAIGRSRTKDLAGRPADNLVELPSGGKAHGVPEYSQYLVSQRADDFTGTLGRKFLGYALGRSLQLSDQPLLDAMQTKLRAHDYRFGILFETVVTSPQFRNQRCRDFSTAHFRTEVPGD